MKAAPDQLSFEEIFAAEAQEIATRHLPGEMETAVPYFRGLIEQFHAEMMKPDYEAALKVQTEADELAYKLNGGNAGIKAGPEAPCYVLERATRAEPGTVPLWGQTGEFIVTVRGAQVRVEMDGMFGTGAMPIPGFSAHVVEPEKPFISETGYRNFCGYNPDIPPGTMPDAYAKLLVEHYLDRDCKGKLRPLKPEYRERFALSVQPQP